MDEKRLASTTHADGRDTTHADWNVDLGSWTLLRAFAYAELVGAYGFLVFVLSNVPLLVLAPASGRLVADPWHYVWLSAVSSAGLVAVALAVHEFGGKRLTARVIDVVGTDDETVFDAIGLGRVLALVLSGAFLTAVLVAHVSSDLLGAAIVLVPILLKIADAVVSLVVPLSGTVDFSNGTYHVEESGRSYDLSSTDVLAAVETGGVTAFCVRGADGVPHVLVLPAELYGRVYET